MYASHAQDQQHEGHALTLHGGVRYVCGMYTTMEYHPRSAKSSRPDLDDRPRSVRPLIGEGQPYTAGEDTMSYRSSHVACRNARLDHFTRESDVPLRFEP